MNAAVQGRIRERNPSTVRCVIIDGLAIDCDHVPSISAAINAHCIFMQDHCKGKKRYRLLTI